jgi:hypothetical protein
MKITTTEITTRKVETMIEDYVFMVQVITDGSCTFSRKYATAVEAVNVYNSFVDHGFALYEREVVLVEPNGLAHGKTFARPAGISIG